MAEKPELTAQEQRLADYLLAGIRKIVVEELAKKPKTSA